MQRHHPGSGRRPVIPSDWSAHHRPVVEGTFTAEVEIREPGGTPGPRDPGTGVVPVTPHAAHYADGARIQVAPVFSAERDSAGQEITVAGYLVVVNRDTSAQTEVGHVVKVTAVDDNGDPALVDRELTVSGVAYGSLSWERDLICIDQLG